MLGESLNTSVWKVEMAKLRTCGKLLNRYVIDYNLSLVLMSFMIRHILKAIQILIYYYTSICLLTSNTCCNTRKVRSAVVFEPN